MIHIYLINLPSSPNSTELTLMTSEPEAIPTKPTTTRNTKDKLILSSSIILMKNPKSRKKTVDI